MISTINEERAEVAEQADALRSGRSEVHPHVGSNPTFGTPVLNQVWFRIFVFLVDG
jgi:hypothetical protein